MPVAPFEEQHPFRKFVVFGPISDLSGQKIGPSPDALPTEPFQPRERQARHHA
jgi:hypothetical protein